MWPARPIARRTPIPYKPLGFDKALGLRRAATLAELAGESWALSLH